MKETNFITPFSTRQFMKSKDFEIYYYYDTNPTAVKAHTHTYYEFYFFIEGNIKIQVGSNVYTMLPGDFLLIPPGTPHNPVWINSDKPYRRFVFWISSEYCDKLMNVSRDYVWLMQYVGTTHTYRFENDVITFNRIQSIILQLIEEIKTDRFGRKSQISLLVNTLILHLNRLINARVHASAQAEHTNVYAAICDYIARNLDKELTLADLESKFFISRFYIAHSFKDHIGISIHSYITKARLKACCEALQGTEPISNIYQQYGFNDYSNFYRAFKLEYGISPAEYRAQCMKPAD